MSKPYLLTVVGPTGAGKTSKLNETISYLGLEPSYTKIIIDDLIESHPYYKQQVADIIKQIDELCKEEGKYCNNDSCEPCDTTPYYKDPSEDLLTSFSKAYFSTRKTKCTPELTCDELNDQNLTNAIKNRDNIVFETTGSYIPTWLLSSKLLTSEYNVIFAYFLQDINQIMSGVKNRALSGIKQFKGIKEFNMSTGNAPRLPDVRPAVFTKQVKLISDVLVNLYDMCILSHDESKCGDIKINRLVLFKNQDHQLINLYDSSSDNLNPSEFKQLVYSSYNINKHGGRKRSIRKHKRRVSRRKSI